VKRLIAKRLPATASQGEVEILRELYIGAIEQLSTRPLHRNTTEEQWAWWDGLDHSKVTVHFYSTVDEPWRIIAFSMVTDRGSFCTPMFAIAKVAWGRGYGQEIIEHYLEVASPKPLYGSQLVSNGAICHLNRKNGWMVLREVDGVQMLFHPNGDSHAGQTHPQEAYDEIVRYHRYGE
jgi:GNAT superfamily N-acetyltransferase